MDLFLFRTSIDLLVITRKNEVLKFPDVRVLLYLVPRILPPDLARCAFNRLLFRLFYGRTERLALLNTADKSFRDKSFVTRVQ